jgi:hypothetical protein
MMTVKMITDNPIKASNAKPNKFPCVKLLATDFGGQ